MYQTGLKMMKDDPGRWFTQLLTRDDTTKILVGDNGQPITDPVTGKIKWGPIVTDEMIAEDRETGMSEALSRQEYYCDFNAALEGAYYSRELAEAYSQDRIGKVPYNVGKPVHTAWDLGLDDSTAIWFFQIINGNIRIIDYKEWTNVSLTAIITEIKKYPYIYGTHIGPHDITTRDLITKESRYNACKKLGIKFYVCPKLGVMDGIEAARRALAISLIDEDKCAQGLNALSQYSKKWDSLRKVFLERPNHDWSSHASDAFRYLAVGFEHITEFDLEGIEMQMGRANCNYDVYSHRGGANAYVANSDYSRYSHR
jgi:hypothetical protein